MIALIGLVALLALIGLGALVSFFIFLTECIKDSIEDANRSNVVIYPEGHEQEEV